MKHAVLFAGAIVIALDAAEAATSLKGQWANPSKSVVLEVDSCGARLCGTVVQASEKAKKDARKGTKQLVGARLLSDLKQKKDGSWTGKLFVPDKNFHVTAKIRLASASKLKVSGCAVAGTICRSQIWTRLGPVD